MHFGPGTRLVLELGGTSISQVDRIDVAGLLSLSGALEVVLTGGFDPAPGDTFDVLNWGVLAGAFASIELPALGPARGWDTRRLLLNGTLWVVPEPGMTALLVLGVAALRRYIPCYRPQVTRRRPMSV